MTDYRETFGISVLSEQADDGDTVKVAVIDTGIPDIPDILIHYSENLTLANRKDDGHATFIGSLLFGNGRIRGLCPNASAGFIKVFENGTTRPETVAKAIRHAVDNWQADMINLSLGFTRSQPCPQVLKEACQHALDNGTLLVAAAGNDGGRALWPAALPGVICVGASDGDAREHYSNYGEIDFVTSGSDLEGYDVNGDVVTRSGTSFSAAIVTGMLALILARRRKKGLDTSWRAVTYDLIGKCKDIGKEGWDTDTGYGFPFGISVLSQTATHGLLYNCFYDKIKTFVRKVISIFTRRTSSNER